MHQYFKEDQLEFTKDNPNYPNTIGHKKFYKRVINKNDMTQNDIFDLIKKDKLEEYNKFRNEIIQFLNNEAKYDRQNRF